MWEERCVCYPETEGGDWFQKTEPRPSGRAARCYSSRNFVSGVRFLFNFLDFYVLMMTWTSEPKGLYHQRSKSSWNTKSSATSSDSCFEIHLNEDLKHPRNERTKRHNAVWRVFRISPARVHRNSNTTLLFKPGSINVWNEIKKIKKISWSSINNLSLNFAKLDHIIHLNRMTKF